MKQETSNPTSVVECMPGRQQWGQAGSWTAHACSSDVSEVEEDEVIDVDATDQVNSMQPHTNIKASRLITLMCHSIDKVHEACSPCACSQYCVPVSSIMTILEFGHSRQVQPSTICTTYFHCTRLWRVWCCNLHLGHYCYSGIKQETRKEPVDNCKCHDQCKHAQEGQSLWCCTA